MGLYSAEVLADNPVRYWKLDETSGTTAVDEKAAGNGTYTGSPTLNQTPASAGTGRSVTFAGSGQFVTAAGPLVVAQTSFTLECWIRVDTVVDAVSILADRSSANPYVMFRARSSGKLNLALARASGAGSQSLDSTSGNINAAGWHHVAVTMSGTAITFYIDGASVGTATRTVIMDGTSTTFQIAQNAVDGSASDFKGGIDEVAVYQTALSGARILAHFNAGPRVTTTGAADLTGTGSQTAAGARGKVGVAALTGAGSSTVAGTQVRGGVAALTGTGSSTSAGKRVRLGVVAASGVGSSTVVGVRIGRGVAPLLGSGVLNASAHGAQLAIAHLVGISTITIAGTGSHVYIGAASLAGEGSLLANTSDRYAIHWFWEPCNHSEMPDPPETCPGCGRPVVVMTRDLEVYCRHDPICPYVATINTSNYAQPLTADIQAGYVLTMPVP